MSDFEMFSQLHHAGAPLLIGNVWDVASANIFEELGFKAIATSSAAVANSLGYKDGENIPFELLLQTVKRIKGNVSIPLSVDMEGGFSRSVDKIIENIEKLHDIGVVGINIEDSLKGDSGTKIQPADVLRQIISSVTNHFERKNIKMFLNARTDAFVVKMPGALEETMTRAKLYEGAGANGIFVPFLVERQDIAAVVASTKLPVNVFALPALPDFTELAALGVGRISMGTSVYNAAKRFLKHAINTIVSEQSFTSLY